MDLHTFFTKEVLPHLRGDISTVFTPCVKFENIRAVSFSLLVKLSPEVTSPNIKGLFSIISALNVYAKVCNNLISNNLISNNVISNKGITNNKMLVYLELHLFYFHHNW